MLLIFLNSDENGVVNVCRWLSYLNKEYILICENDVIEFIYTSLEADSFIIKINNRIIESSCIEGIWFRKIPFNLTEESSRLIIGNPTLDAVFKTYINLELSTLSEYLNILSHESMKTVGSSQTIYVNKLLQLHYAKKVGIKIPQTEILTDLGKFSEKFGNSTAITKGIYDTFIFNTGAYSGSSRISQIQAEDVDKWDVKTLRPSLFQAYVEKLFEIRSFFFKEKFYSMAIFSQANEKTKIDFRNYDMDKPNRMVPFILPECIEEKLKSIARYLLIDTGSFDLIYGLDDEIYFLEVNPVGQFDFVSGMCNYNIEKVITKYFVNE